MLRGKALFALSILLADMGVVGGNVTNFMTERKGELGLVIHQSHELAGYVNITSRHRKSVLDGRIERREMQRLPGIGDARESPNAAADGLHVSGPRTRFRASQLTNQLGMIALRFGDVLRIEIAQLLRGGRSDGQSSGGEKKDPVTHDSSNFLVSCAN